MIDIILDTETTGISIKDGHRIVEAGCIELDDLIQPKKFSLLLESQNEKFLKKR